MKGCGRIDGLQDGAKRFLTRTSIFERRRQSYVSESEKNVVYPAGALHGSLRRFLKGEVQQIKGLSRKCPKQMNVERIIFIAGTKCGILACSGRQCVTVFGSNNPLNYMLLSTVY